MYILSSFNSDYLKAPLEHLLKNFSQESIDIKYANTNIIIWLTQLQSSKEKNQSVAILFRVYDLREDINEKITNKVQIEKNLNELIEQIKQFKKLRTQPLIITLCPSPKHFYCDDIKKLEENFLREMQDNRIHTLSQLEIQQYYALTNFNNHVEHTTHIPYNCEFYVSLICLLARKLHCIKQQPYKVILVDCDNTLWDGIAGDIGPENVKFEAHNLALQKFLIKQKENGVFICLCSKNEENTVDQVFSLRKEEMPLKMSDVIFKEINRNSKSSNILAMLTKLKLSNAKNAMFIDDSDNEIEEVSRNLPEIFCVTMPQTLKGFNASWAFDLDEHLSITQTARERLSLFKEDNSEKTSSEFIDPIKRIKDKREKYPLEISKITKAQEAEIERIIEISDRTNQFNLFPEDPKDPKKMNIRGLIEKNEIDCFIATITSVSAQQEPTEKENVEKEVAEGSKNEYLIKGDLTALVICKTYVDHLLVNGFFLSCRNTSLDVEYALINYIAEYAHDNQLNKIKIKFKKTEKNKLAETFIDILCDQANKASVVRFFLRNTKRFSSVQSIFKSLFKKMKILPIDFDKKLNEEITFEFYTNSLIELDPYLLVRETLKANAEKTNNLSRKRLISENDKANAKLYLKNLEKETKSIQSLMEKFFGFTLKDSLIEQLSSLLNIATGNFPQDTALIFLGLDSLKAALLSSSLYKKQQVEINISTLLCHKTTIVTLLEFIKEKKDKQVITKLMVPSSPEYNNLKGMPVSLQQQRIWHAEQKEGVNNSSNYHMIACYSVKKLDINRFKQACLQLIGEYDVFGAVFYLDKGQLVQSIIPSENRVLAFAIKELSNEVELLPAIREEISKPRSMTGHPLIRFTIFQDKASPNSHIFFHVHHCIFDAFSLKTCLDTLSIFYNDTLALSPQTMPAFSGYIDFIKEQNKKLEDIDLQEQAKKYWSEQLAILDEVVEIPYDKIVEKFKPAVEQVAQRYSFEIEGFSALKNLAKVNSVTPYSIVSSLFSILISAYTYQEKLAIITATSGREAAFINTVGFFVNLLVQPFNLEVNKSFIEYIIENNKNFLASLTFQDYPFHEIQKILQNQDVSDVLRYVALIYQSYEEPKLKLGDEPKLTLPENPILFDLREFCRFGHFTIFVREDGEKLNCLIEYAEELYSDRFIKRIADNFNYLVQNVTSKPEQMLHDIEIVCDKEREQLLKLSMGPKLDVDEASNKNLIHCFQKNVLKYSDNIALKNNEFSFTYAALDNLATKLAVNLQRNGIKKGDNVGIYTKKNSHLFFIAELAILKAAAVFVPLSKENPGPRLAYIIKNAEIEFVLSDDNFTLNEKLEIKDCFKGFNLNFIDIQQVVEARSDNDLNDFFAINEKIIQEINMEDTVCILYTSGSTGNPKGVILNGKGIYRVVESPNFIKVIPGDKILQTANPAFDAAQLECWLAWNNGGCLVVCDKEDIVDTKLFEAKLKDENISHMWLTAALFNSHATQPTLFNGLKYLMVGGDIVAKNAILKVLDCEQPPTIINGYGPTETSIFALTYTFNKKTFDSFDTSPIGRPINNTSIQVLTRFGQLAPFCGIGQLAICGDGLGGYLKLLELERASFVYVDSNLRTYMTGDLVKWNVEEDSQMMFIGRINALQIKINGNLVFTIEVKDILSQHKAIKQVEVLLKKEENGSKYLIAFYQLNPEVISEPTVQELRGLVAAKKPSYMIPSYFKKVENFPRTDRDKLDARKLLSIALKETIKNYSIQMLTRNEQIILQLVTEVLPPIPNNIDIDDDFFEMGGDSIQAMELTNKINNYFNKNIKANVIYGCRTVRKLNKFLNLKKDEILESSSLIILKEEEQKGSALPAVVFIHPAGGGVRSCFNKLIEQVKLPNACYGIEDPILHKNEFVKLAMEEMASSYLAIIKAEIKRPFILAGYSFGGMLALEMAAQIEDSLKRNEYQKNYLLKVILFDTWVVSCASSATKVKLKQQVLNYCAEQRKRAYQNKLSDFMELLEKVCEHHQNIGFSFVPKQLSFTPVSLLKAKELAEQFTDMAKEENNYLSDFVKKELFTNEQVSGDHFNMLGIKEELNENSLDKIFSNHVKSLSSVTLRQSFFSDFSDKQDNANKIIVGDLPKIKAK